MNKGNAATVGEFFSAVQRRDLSAALAVLDSDVEWVAPASLPYGGCYRGPQEVATRYFPGFLEHVDDDFELLADEVTQAGERVVVRGRLRGPRSAQRHPIRSSAPAGLVLPRQPGHAARVPTRHRGVAPSGRGPDGRTGCVTC